MLNVENPRIKVFTNFIKDLATLSKCTDRGVAAIIINAEATQVYSIGINGGPKNGLDCLCTLGGKYSCVHAEANALAKCKTEDQHKIMLCTLSPCVTCASLIVNSGFDAVFYLDIYKDDKGLEILNKAGIRTISLKMNPYMPPSYTPPPIYQSPTIFPNGIPPVTVTSEVTVLSELDPAVKTFLDTGSINIPLVDELSYSIVKEYINKHNIKTQARVDNGNQIIKIWRI